MTNIYSISSHDDVSFKLDEVITYLGYKVDWAENESKLLDDLSINENHIVFLPQSASYDVYSLCGKISDRFPFVTKVLVFRLEEELDMKEALRAGADDVIFLSFPISKVKEDINLAVSRNKNILHQQIENVKNARVITVASTKGGIGKTTVAVNLAASFGKKLEKVAVIDLDLQFGDVAMFLDVKPKRTIYDWVKEDSVGTQIKDFMTHYKDGIFILSAPQRPEFAEVITGNNIRKAIEVLRKQFDVVIIDASSHMDENVIVALENSDEILVMTCADLPTLKNSKMLIDTLTSLDLDEKVKVVLNRQMKVKGITINTVTKVVGREIFTALPVMEKLMITAVNEGKPAVYSNPRSKVAKRIFQMAETLVNPENSSGINKQKVKRMVHAGGHA
ncbi:AAA family ATPase [Bacillus sp. JJ1532]|uniref:AAA family ATPase n=1 Tax=unclassified Bacillus (in: firmicutes) TaxID=185979 RepID=UPI002FFE6875